MFPELEVETYWYNMPGYRLMKSSTFIMIMERRTVSPEIKSDLGVERFPSCHFASNSLILHLALLAYNILRIIGQTSIEEQNEEPLPVNRCKKVSRRRPPVMQDLIYMAGRLIYRGRKWFISFGRINPFARLADRVLQRLRDCPG
jgi:hypothetical protein